MCDKTKTCDIMSRYKEIKKIGEGSYGIVYEAFDKEISRKVAIKGSHSDTMKQGIPASSLREITVLKELKHPNIVDLLDVHLTEGRLYMVFDLLWQDLGHLLTSAGKLSPTLVKSYMYQLLSGLSFCHTHQVIHRDLKPQNLLIDKKGNIKLADFGMARHFSLPIRVYTVEVVTQWYRATELLLGAKMYTMAIDMWSLGCIFGEMLKGSPMFPGDCEIDQLFRIFRVLGTPTDEMWPGVNQLTHYKACFPKWKPIDMASVLPMLEPSGRDLIKEILVYNPNLRISAMDALKHEYFTTVKVVAPPLPEDKPKEGSGVFDLMCHEPHPKLCSSE